MSDKLSVLVDKEMGKYGSQPGFEFWNNLYFPSKPLVFWAFIAAVFVCWLSVIEISHPLVSKYFSPSDGIASNLVSVHSGVGAIIFALLIFVAESLREEDSKDRARVLLRESMLFPLTLSGLLVFFVFLFGKVNYIAVLPVFGVGVFTIWSVYKTVAILLNRTEFAKMRCKVLRERLRQSLTLSIRARFGRDIFLKKIGVDKKAVYQPTLLPKKHGRTVFTQKKYGVVVDIDFCALREIVDIINGTYYEGRILPEMSTDINKISEEAIRAQEGQKLFINTMFYEQVYPESILCYVDGELNGPDLKEIQLIVERAFDVRPAHGISDEVRNEVAGIKDQMLDAISSGHTGKVEELYQIYLELCDEFAESLSRYSGNYSQEQAERETKMMGGGWVEVEWLKRDINEVFHKAIESENLAVASEIIYLPVAISIKAIEHKDFYIFQTFIGFSRFLYEYATQVKNEKFKEYLYDRAWRHLVEIAHYVIQPKIRNCSEVNSKEEIGALKGFAFNLFIVFQGMLKNALDNRDLHNFESFKKAASGLFDYLGDSDEEDANLVCKEISAKRQQLFFHLASWILDQKDVLGDTFQDFFRIVDSEIESNVSKIDALFWQTHTREAEDFWGWSLWELHEDGGAQFVDVFGRLERYYVFKMLNALVRDANRITIEGYLPARREYGDLCSPTGGVGSFIKELKVNSSKWRAILGEELVEKISSLEALFSDAQKRWREEELREKRERTISKVKLGEFRKEVLMGMEEVPRLKNVLAYYGLVKDKTKTTSSSGNRFGINTVLDKAAFFENWHVYFGEYGKHYGEGLAAGETRDILDKVAVKCSELRDAHSGTLSGDGWIAITTTRGWERFSGGVREDQGATSEIAKGLDLREFEGYCCIDKKIVPVFYALRKDNKKQFLLVNVKKLGHLVVKNPLNMGEDSSLVSNGVYINVRAFSEDQTVLDEIIGNPPDWLKAKGGKEEQRQHLLEHVLVNILERFEYEPKNDFVGYSIVK